MSLWTLVSNLLCLLTGSIPGSARNVLILNNKLSLIFPTFYKCRSLHTFGLSSGFQSFYCKLHHGH